MSDPRVAFDELLARRKANLPADWRVYRETPRERAERQRDAFNARYPVGTPVRVYPGRMGDHASAYDTAVAKPGAFIMGGDRGTQVSVKVPGDSIALTHVVPLVPLSATPSA